MVFGSSIDIRYASMLLLTRQYHCAAHVCVLGQLQPRHTTAPLASWCGVPAEQV